MKKIILSLSLLFCLIFISIEAISIGQNSTQNTTKDNQIDLMGNITHKGTRTLIKPIVLMQSEGVLEASFVEKLGLKFWIKQIILYLNIPQKRTLIITLKSLLLILRMENI